VYIYNILIKNYKFYRQFENFEWKINLVPSYILLYYASNKQQYNYGKTIPNPEKCLQHLFCVAKENIINI